MYEFNYRTGPIDEDQHGGDICNIHVEALNLSGSPRKVKVWVRNLKDYSVIEYDAKLVGNLEHRYWSIDTHGAEHVDVEISYHNVSGSEEVLFTVYGRNRDFVDLPGATYRHTELVFMQQSVVPI